jgi:hypothetical protein
MFHHHIFQKNKFSNEIILLLSTHFRSLFTFFLTKVVNCSDGQEFDMLWQKHLTGKLWTSTTSPPPHIKICRVQVAGAFYRKGTSNIYYRYRLTRGPSRFLSNLHQDDISFYI